MLGFFILMLIEELFGYYSEETDDLESTIKQIGEKYNVS